MPSFLVLTSKRNLNRSFSFKIVHFSNILASHCSVKESIPVPLVLCSEGDKEIIIFRTVGKILVLSNEQGVCWNIYSNSQFARNNLQGNYVFINSTRTSSGF